MEKETPEYKVAKIKVRNIIHNSELTELQKYALLSSTITEVAHKYNGNDFSAIKIKMALVCKTMLNAVEAAERVFGKFVTKK